MSLAESLKICHDLDALIVVVAGHEPRDIAMNITLTAEHADFVQTKLQSGKYVTVNQLLMEAFSLLEERDRDYTQWVEETRIKIDAAAESLDRGEGLDGEMVVNRMLERFRQARMNEG